MKIKKFQAPSFREALARVKKELGDEAVILSSEEINGLRPKVEVVAAIDQDLGPGGNLGTHAYEEAESAAETRRFGRPTRYPCLQSSCFQSTKVSPSLIHEQILQELGESAKSLEELKRQRV